MMAFESSLNYGYVNPQVTLLITLLMVVNMLLVGLAWHNLKEIRKLMKGFFDSDSANKIATALEKDKQADRVREEFLNHIHGPDGRVCHGG